MHRAWICAALVLASSAGAVPVASATGRPIAAETVSSCIASWNAAPPAAATAGHARRNAVVAAYAPGTGEVTWTRTSSSAIHGPACKVTVIEPSGRALVVYANLTPGARAVWKRLYPGLVKPEPGETANALVGASGLLRVR